MCHCAIANELTKLGVRRQSTPARCCTVTEEEERVPREFIQGHVISTAQKARAGLATGSSRLVNRELSYRTGGRLASTLFREV